LVPTLLAILSESMGLGDSEIRIKA